MTLSRSDSLGSVAKLVLATRILLLWARVLVGLRRHSLPEFVNRLSGGSSKRSRVFSPDRLSRAVDRVLQVGPFQPRCIIKALVLYRLLRAQGTLGELVIGLPEDPFHHVAHAWVEIDGMDVGPSPGRGDHEELARYP